MKTAVLMLLLASVPWAARAEDQPLPALKAIEQFGSVSVTDGSSFFTFSKDGSFRSGPLGESGRTFEGHWTADGMRFTVTAKLGWMNGASSGHDYRRIVFVIYALQKRAPETKPFFGEQPHELCDGYFLVDELVKIPEPPSPSK